MKLLKVNGAEIAVYEYGKKDEVIVLLHPGGIFASYVWNEVIKELKNSFRIIAIDIRGHGKSEKTKTGYEMSNLALDIFEVLKELEINKAHIVGNSLGGEIGLFFAANYPEIVQSLTLIDAGLLNLVGPNGEREGTKEDLIQERLNRPYPEYETEEEFRQFVRESWRVFASIAEHIPLLKTKNGTLTFQQDNEIAAALLEASCSMDMKTYYATLSCPILFLPAEQEEKLDIKLNIINDVKDNVPYTKTTIIPNSTHLMMLEHSQPIVVEWTAFYNEIFQRA